MFQELPFILWAVKHFLPTHQPKQRPFPGFSLTYKQEQLWNTHAIEKHAT